MAQKQFFLLKGVGLATQELTEEYNTIIETVENGREVTWADQSMKEHNSCNDMMSSFILSFQSTSVGKFHSITALETHFSSFFNYVLNSYWLTPPL